MLTFIAFVGFVSGAQKVSDIWLAALERIVIPITKKSNFFSAGRNSLLLLKLQAEMRKTFGVKFSLPALFQMDTLESLARRLEVSKSWPTNMTILGSGLWSYRLEDRDSSPGAPSDPAPRFTTGTQPYSLQQQKHAHHAHGRHRLPRRCVGQSLTLKSAQRSCRSSASPYAT